MHSCGCRSPLLCILDHVYAWEKMPKDKKKCSSGFHTGFAWGGVGGVWKWKFWNHLNYTHLKILKCIAIEGLEMKSVHFDEILKVFKE